MGQYYDVTARLRVKDEAGAIKALQEHIKNDTRSRYNLELFAEEGVTTKTFDDLMRIFLAGWKRCNFVIDKSQHEIVYTNGFNASYSWESVMMEMFESLTPYLEDGSSLVIYPDEGYDKLVVKDGKCA